MTIDTVRYQPHLLEDVVHLSLRAWAPVFESIEQAMDPEVFRLQHPDWRAMQKAAVESACADLETWVACEDGTTLGFVSLQYHRDDAIGEIHMIATDPDHQWRGAAATLTQLAMTRFAEEGMTTAMVETGGDPGHAPARATYEAAGFRALPLVRYFRAV